MKKEKRFVRIHKQGHAVGEGADVWVDKVTGVHYVYMFYGYSGGVTPLLDSEGKVIVDKSVLCNVDNK